jgi:hypothetical protein
MGGSSSLHRRLESSAKFVQQLKLAAAEVPWKHDPNDDVTSTQEKFEGILIVHRCK